MIGSKIVDDLVGDIRSNDRDSDYCDYCRTSQNLAEINFYFHSSMHASMQPSLQLLKIAFDSDIKDFNCAAAERTECWISHE